MAGATIIPTMRYRDAHRMIDWLCATFGFARHAVYEDGEGGVAHAQLTLGEAMIMLGTARDDAFGLMQQPPQADAPVTQSAYIVVPDADSVYRAAKAAGAAIVYDIRDEDYGGRGFSCRDPEGQLWSFGTYDPWKETAGSGDKG
jgi:uncharacterized glyoxalase superfamily protein PhnB